MENKLNNMTMEIDYSVITGEDDTVITIKDINEGNKYILRCNNEIDRMVNVVVNCVKMYGIKEVHMDNIGIEKAVYDLLLQKIAENKLDVNVVAFNPSSTFNNDLNLKLEESTLNMRKMPYWTWIEEGEDK